MQLDETLLKQLKLHTKSIIKALPNLSKEERINLITKAITDSNDVPSEVKAETIKSLIEITDK